MNGTYQVPSFDHWITFLPLVSEIWKEGEFAIMSRNWKQKRGRDD